MNEYQKALDRLVKAYEEMKAVVSTAISAGESFKGWETCHVDSLNGTLSKSIEAWPSQDRVKAAVTEWKSAKKLAEKAWDDLPIHSRLGMIEPKDFKPAMWSIVD